MTTPQKDREGLMSRLLSGKFFIKEGHRVKFLNPNGEATTIPLGGNQIEERILQLAQLVKDKELSVTSAEVQKIIEKYPNFRRLFQ